MWPYRFAEPGVVKWHGDMTWPTAASLQLSLRLDDASKEELCLLLTPLSLATLPETHGILTRAAAESWHPALAGITCLSRPVVGADIPSSDCASDK